MYLVLNLNLQTFCIYTLFLIMLYYRFAWQGFGSQGVIGVVSVRSCKKLPPYLIKPVPAGSERNPLLAKAKPISEGSSTSVITDLRRGRKNCGEITVEREK